MRALMRATLVREIPTKNRPAPYAPGGDIAVRLSRVPEAMRISRRTMRIARQCIGAGLGLSAAAMLVAAFGGLQPTAGALLQEGIDLAVILNALRASR